MENLRPNGQRAKNAIILIWIVLIMEIICLASGYFQYELLQRAAIGEIISIDEASANDLREQILGVIYMIAYVVSAVTFIQWFRRAYFNLHLKVRNLSHSDGWAAGSWFVPFICLFRPYQIMRELYQETINFLTKKGSTGGVTTKFLGWWWALWIIGNAIGQFVFRYSMKAETVEQLITVTEASMISNIIGIPLAFITVKIILDYNSIETKLYDLKEEVKQDSQLI